MVRVVEPVLTCGQCYTFRVPMWSVGNTHYVLVAVLTVTRSVVVPDVTVVVPPTKTLHFSNQQNSCELELCSIRVRSGRGFRGNFKQ